MAMRPVHVRLCIALVLWIVYMNFAASLAPVQSPNYNGPARAPVSPASPGSSQVSPPPRSPSLPPASPAIMKWKGPSRGLNGGEKAGIVIGTLTGAGLLAFFGMVYKKRRSNIRRARLGHEARRPIL